MTCPKLRSPQHWMCFWQDSMQTSLWKTYKIKLNFVQHLYECMWSDKLYVCLRNPWAFHVLGAMPQAPFRFVSGHPSLEHMRLPWSMCPATHAGPLAHNVLLDTSAMLAQCKNAMSYFNGHGTCLPWHDEVSDEDHMKSNGTPYVQRCTKRTLWQTSEKKAYLVCFVKASKCAIADRPTPNQTAPIWGFNYKHMVIHV